MKNYILAVAVLILMSACQAFGGEKPVECRAMWVARWSITSPAAVKRIVELAKKYNYNALIVQVRGRGDAFYKSNFEPRSQMLDGQPESFDPLAMMIEECRREGLQIHAWMNTHFTWESATKPKSPEHIVNKHPEWLMRVRSGEVTFTAGGQSEGAYTCPSNPQVKEHVKNCFMDVAKNYDVDGIHFDFVRYPSVDYCYCDGCLARFKAQMDKNITPEEKLILESFPERIGYTLAFPAKWDNFRRQQITELVSAIYKEARKVKPQIIVSASVFPDFNDAYNYRFQDWKKWLEMGVLDLLCPMAYATETPKFAEHIKDAVSASKGQPVYAGIGAWRITPESTIEKVKEARKIGAKGLVLFSYDGVAGDGSKETYLQTLQKEVFPDQTDLPLTKGGAVK